VPDTKTKQKITSRDLTRFLRELGAEVHTIDNEGKVITRAEALAEAIWKRALGYSETNKKGEDVYHPPEMVAIQLIYERVEGRAAVSLPEDKKGQSVAERVTELGKSRINRSAESAVAVPSGPGPVGVPEDGAQGSEGPDAEPSV
jgi:hypothetical protein